MALTPGSSVAHYRISAAIGAGGMGEVYRATDTTLGREIALKLLPQALASDPDRLARFEREARLLAALNHPGIAHLYGFERVTLDDGTKTLALAMELVDGEDLAARLKRGRIPTDEALGIARQIAEALEEAHEKGIVHRDLKPANVKLTPDGRTKVLDFGLAKAWAVEPTSGSDVDLSRSPTLARTGTQAGVILGTAAYMSPEQARGRAVDKRSDVWSFGALLFEVLAGRRLFEGETVTDVLACVVKEPIPWDVLAGDVPPSIRRLLLRCLERDPRLRLRDIGEARIALSAPGPDEAASQPAAPRQAGLARALPWAVAGVALGLAAWSLLRAAPQGRRAAGVVHLDVGFPPEVDPVSGRQGGIAVSPDGQSIAMVGFKDGERRLFVRRLDSPEAADVSASSGAGTFAPDSRSVALVSNATTLSRVSLADGRSSPLATGGDFVSGVSLAWGPGRVVFSRGGSLWSVPEAGGDVRPLTTLDAASGEVLHADPLVLPGGRSVLFSRLASGQGAERIEAVPIDGGPRSVVVEGATTPVWSPTGHLLFGRDGAIWAMPFDPAAVKALGPAVLVIPAGVVGSVRWGSPGFQVAENGTLVFVPVHFADTRLVTVGRDGAERPLDLPAGSFGNPRVSPDGRRLAVEENGAVESVDLGRGTRSVVVPAALGTNFLIWTRDGTRLVFRRFNVPFWTAADGSGQMGLVPQGDTNMSPASAGPDASSFIVVRLRPETAGDVFLMSIDGSFEPRPLVATPAYEGSPHLSPDMKWLIYQSNASGRPEIYVRRYPELDRAWPVSEGGGVQARWDPSGREIYYRGGGQLMSVAFDGRGAEPQLGRPNALFADVYDFGQGLSIPDYDVTRDGRFLMLRRGTQGGTLRVVLNWTEELKRTLAQGGVK